MKTDIGKAAEAAKKVVGEFYDKKCDVYKYVEVNDGAVTEKNRVLALKDVPCRLSHKAFSHNRENGAYSEVEYVVKIFYPPEFNIEEGSEVSFELDGEIYEFNMAGKSASYLTHKEAVLKNGKRWA